MPNSPSLLLCIGAAHVERRFDIHQEGPRDFLSLLGLLRAVHEHRDRIDCRPSFPAPILPIVELVLPFQVVRYEMRCR